jgi:hypothetical protein
MTTRARGDGEMEKRPTLADMRELIHCDTVRPDELCDYLDAMHDRLRDEVVRELTDEMQRFRDKPPYTEPMTIENAAIERVRAVFDRRKRRGR